MCPSLVCLWHQNWSLDHPDHDQSEHTLSQHSIKWLKQCVKGSDILRGEIESDDRIIRSQHGVRHSVHVSLASEFSRSDVREDRVDHGWSCRKRRHLIIDHSQPCRTPVTAFNTPSSHLKNLLYPFKLMFQHPRIILVPIEKCFVTQHQCHRTGIKRGNSSFDY